MHNYVSKNDIPALYLTDKKTVKQVLMDEINRLKDLLQREINRWYAAYNPIMYSRTYSMREAIKADNMVRVENAGSLLTVRLQYTDNVYHKSLWSDTSINTLYLLNYGYQVSRGWHKDIPYFGYRSPGGYLDDAIREFNQNSKLGFKASLIVPASFYK